jgi:hypothetical protein
MSNKGRFSNTITSTPCHSPLMTSGINLALRHIARPLVTTVRIHRISFCPVMCLEQNEHPSRNLDKADTHHVIRTKRTPVT